MLGEQFFVNGADHFQVRLDGIQVQQRHAKFVGSGERDLLGAGEPFVDQMGDQIDLFFLGNVRRVNQRVFSDYAVLD